MQAVQENRDNSDIRNLIWLYFWLLIFEGALRKWFLPQLSTPLLLIRDPVILITYSLSLSRGIFPKNALNILLLYLAFISFIASIFSLIFYSESNFLVTLYGMRTNFLHLPLIFLMPKVFDLDEVRQVGKWFLLLALPMAILMVFQFNSPPDAWINTTAGGEGTQIASSLGKIRTPGIFTFISAVADYFSLVTAFLLYGLMINKTYPYWLLFLAGIGLVTALIVAGSRSTIGIVATVNMFWFVSLLVNRKLLQKSYKAIILILVVVLLLSFTTFFNQGIEVITSRIEEASGFENENGGIVGRFFSSFTEPFLIIEQVPFLGYGLGMGTNGGSFLLTNQLDFLLAEGEWSRLVMESGLIVGFLFISWRVGLIITLGKICFKQLLAQNILPWLLLGACILNILIGQFSRPSTLGFAVFGGGLCLASCQAFEQKLKSNQ